LIACISTHFQEGKQAIAHGSDADEHLHVHTQKEDSKNEIDILVAKIHPSTPKMSSNMTLNLYTLSDQKDFPTTFLHIT